MTVFHRLSSDPSVSIIVPARNEARNLELVLPRLPDVHEVIVVDGHSSDDTASVVRRTLPSATFLQQTRRGKGNALACGFEAATGDVIVMFDADGSADPAEIDAYVTALRSGADFAKGSRVLADGGSEDITALRDLGNRALTTATNLLFRTRYTDLCYGYNAFWRDILPALGIPSSRHEQPRWGDGFEIETLINCRVAAAGLQIHEVPSVERERIHGESNLNTFRDGFRVLRTIVTERFRRGSAHVAVPSADVLTAHPDAQHSRDAGPLQVAQDRFAAGRRAGSQPGRRLDVPSGRRADVQSSRLGRAGSVTGGAESA